MNKFYQKDNLKPSLLDRLTDEAPRKRNEGKLSSILSIQQYRKKILRDIMFLLNSSMLFNNDSQEEYSIDDNVRASTLNYGTPSLSGMIISNIDWLQVENEIQRALVSFEERLQEDSIKVVIHLNEPNMVHESELLIEIYGKLKLSQYDQEFWLKTKVDVETGIFSLVGNSNE